MSIYDTPETAAYGDRMDGDGAARRDVRDVGAQAFVWIAWTVAFAFWAGTMSSFVGIFSALTSGVPGGVQDGSAGVVGLLVIVGVIVLAAALFFGLARRAPRDGLREPITEASTQALYDATERTEARGDHQLA